MSSPSTHLLRKKEGLISLLICVMFWGGFLTYSGTVTSGYHLIDDWTMLYINQEIMASNPFAVAVDLIKVDLQWRFRPMYHIYQEFSLWLCGTNFTALSILLLAQAVFSSWFLYLFAREIGFGRLSSTLFVALTFLGPQSSIWWQLGPAESLGMFWLALGLLFMSKAASGTKTPRSQTVVAVLAFIFASMTKESFVVLLPVLMLWWLLLYIYKTDSTPTAAIRSHLIPIVTLAITCLVELAIIFFVVGTTGLVYAGVDAQSLTLRNLLGSIKTFVMSTNPFLTFSLLTTVAALLVISFALTRGNLRKKLDTHFALLVELASVGSLVFLYTLSQGALYAKSGLDNRYLVPCALILGFLVIYLIAKAQQIITHRSLRLAATIVLTAAALASTATQYAVAIAAAKSFTHYGVTLHQALDKVGTPANSSDPILIVADPAHDFEATFAARTFLNMLFKRNNVFVYPVLTAPEESYSDFFKSLIRRFDSELDADVDKLADKSQIRAIFTYSRAKAKTDQSFRSNSPSWFDDTNFVRSEFGQFVVYVREPLKH